MRDHGRPEEKRVHFHGQGYDVVECPLIRHDEKIAIRNNMYFSLHPAFSTPHGYSWISDDYFLDADGKVERLHTMPQELVEID